MQASLDGSENTKNAPYRAAGGVVTTLWLLCCGFGVEAEGGGVDAVALARGGRSVFEQVSLVGSADGAVYLGAAHEEAAVLLRLYVCFVERPPEAWPTRAGIVLAVRREQGRAARDTAVDPLLLVVVVLTAEGPLRAFHPRDAILLGGELVLPLFFRLLYLSRRISHGAILARCALRAPLVSTALASPGAFSARFGPTALACQRSACCAIKGCSRSRGRR